MPGADRRTVNIKGDPLKLEYTSAAIMTVGMVVEDAATPGMIQASSVASATYPGGRMIVAEAPERGKGIYATGTTENTYAIGEQVACVSIQSGNEYLVLLTAAQAITRGGELEVAATGKVITVGTGAPAFTALETLTATGQDILIQVRAL